MHHTTVHASCINMCALPNYLKLPYLIVLLLLMLKSIFFSLSGPPVHRLFIFSFIKQFDIFTLSSLVSMTTLSWRVWPGRSRAISWWRGCTGWTLSRSESTTKTFQVREHNQTFPGQGVKQNFPGQGVQQIFPGKGVQPKLPRSGSTTKHREGPILLLLMSRKITKMRD